MSYSFPRPPMAQPTQHRPVQHTHSHSLPLSHARSHRRSGQTQNTSRFSLYGGAGFSPDDYDDTPHDAHAHAHAQDHDHDHHDHGHDHSHSHSHDHSHDHPHIHPHNHSHDHSHDEPHTHQHAFSVPLARADDKASTISAGAYASTYAPPDASPAVFQQVGPATAQTRLTALLLQQTAQYPLLHAVVKDQDSRRIFYFMSLNFAFMTVQAFYGYVTDSLGLLSDSIHMFFDCVALGVGLFAAVASKWPASERFPYGFGKIETLSGFANGVFLILISVEIMVEAVERLLGGRETQRLMELFVVSTLGLLVNLVGMFSFGHHHHGHGGGHDCGHGNGHDHHDHHDHHGHDHHDHDHHAHSHDHSHHAHGHNHSHGNENMYGIYLHVLADTLGSAAVIVSTLLTRVWSWSGWDPLASFLIAVLILGSSVPLVLSSARRLLLTIPDTVEYALRETLAGVPGLLGVAGYAAPKFWLDDREGDAAAAAAGTKLLGVIHVVAVRGADVGDVRDRVRSYMLERGIDVVVQVEREGDNNCWCGLGLTPGASGGGGGGGGTHGPSMSVSMGRIGGHGPTPSISY